MKRIEITPRPDWEKKITDLGFLFYKEDCYYNETAAYEFTASEINQIESATGDIFEMCLEVVEHVIDRKLWEEFRIPAEYTDLIEWSWKNDNPSFYGRFDLGFNNGQVKLFEFNADTPTLLLESSVIQWHWLQDYNPGLDQYNNIHELLLAHMKECQPYLHSGTLHFTSGDNMEDFMSAKYLEDVAYQSGLNTKFLYIDNLGLDDHNRFVDEEGELIKNIFKLYPYEWMFREPFGKHLVTNRDSCLWIEPPYKAIISNKMMLKYLYHLFPMSPYILPCTSLQPEDPRFPLKDFVKKPIFSREGENVSIYKSNSLYEATDGDYGYEGHIYQQYFEVPDFNGHHPIIGSWVIGGEPAGLGIRESTGRITNTYSSFCPHYII